MAFDLFFFLDTETTQFQSIFTATLIKSLSDVYISFNRKTVKGKKLFYIFLSLQHFFCLFISTAEIRVETNST